MRYQLKGLDCPNCAAKIEEELHKIEGLESVTIHFATQSIDLPTEMLPIAEKVIARTEPNLKLEAGQAENTLDDELSERKQLLRISMAGILLIGGLLFQHSLQATPFYWAEYAVFIPAFLVVGWPVIRKAIGRILRGELFDENFLMSVATVGAIAIHQMTEAVAVMLFYAVGEYLQAKAVNRSKRSIVALLNVQPDVANVKVDNELIQLNPRQVEIGQTVVIKPGEKVPLDGEVLAGSSFVNTAALTGESVPRKVEPGSTVLAGMINGSGLLSVRVTKLYSDSSIAKILNMVETAAERKAPTENFITKFSHYYTPIVVVVALLLAFIPPLVVPGSVQSDWIYRALVLLVISCPCALMISIPLGYFGGIGGASRHGILVKGANYLDVLANVKTVVFDKTGTLTQGVFRVVEVEPSQGFSKSEMLTLAAAVEKYSTHPIAKSILEANGSFDTDFQVTDFREIPGLGVSAMVNGKKVQIGNDQLLHRLEVKHDTCNLMGTVVHIVVDSKYAGYLIVADEMKADAKPALDRLKKLGIQETVLLTGDEVSTARGVADYLGINQCYAGLLPEGKVTILEQHQSARSKQKHYKLAFVGDGINDAPVLTRADVGIAMGGLGSDAAIEAADVVIMEDQPLKVATAIELARYTRGIIMQNVVMAIGVKLFFVVLGSFGVATIWEAVFADVGVTVFAVLNATRSLHFKTKFK